MRNNFCNISYEPLYEDMFRSYTIQQNDQHMIWILHAFGKTNTLQIFFKAELQTEIHGRRSAPVSFYKCVDAPLLPQGCFYNVHR